MAAITIQQAFDAALQHHQAGRLAEAEELYRRILAQQPAHADATHLLGVIAQQVARHDMAIDLIRQAIAVRPSFPEAFSNLGISLTAAGRLDEAIAACRQAIALRPDHPEAYVNLGIALKGRDLLDEAIAAYRQAIVLKPDFSKGHYNLGNALMDKGQPDQALIAFRQALALRPDDAEALVGLGSALMKTDQLDEAIAAYRQAIALRPDYAGAHSNLGNALRDKGKLDEAIAACRQAVALDPNLPEAHSNLGSALRDKGQLDQAIAEYRKTIALKPQLSEGYVNLGAALSDRLDLEGAIAAYRQAIALTPESAKAHSTLALALLLQGEFRGGWEENEWRMKLSADGAPAYPVFRQPQWDGRPLPQGTIVLYAEQGFGDTIQFARYVPLVAERCGKVIVVCQTELHRLLRNSSETVRWVTSGEPLAPFESQCSLVSLPLAFNTELETIPHVVPYLQPDPREIERWRGRLDQRGAELKVGLVWAGNSRHNNDRNRSLPLTALAPLAGVRAATFYSLQKGEAAEQAKNPPAGMKLTDWSHDLTDFAASAALIANLDLVISVDTAAAHLAGAMGKPVWTLLPFAPDWRWLLDRSDSPWYPTMRLFRQPSAGDWQSAIQQVAEALRMQHM